MPPTFHRLCQENADYRQLWNEIWAGRKPRRGASGKNGSKAATGKVAISRRTAQSTLAKIFAGPPQPLPDNWWKWKNVQDFHAQAATAFLDTIPEFPKGAYAGRGIVICGGGRYLPSVYVTISALRHVGCQLPIELWYFGRREEFPARAAAIFKPFGVTAIDADEVRLRHPFRTLNSYEIKPFATFHSRFEEVLFLDADCYPCRNPEPLFECRQYKKHGATFWSDLEHTVPWLNWTAFRVAADGRPPIESGQYLIHKRRAWTALNLTLWYNDHSDFTYRHTFGDKELWHVAFARLGQSFAMYQDRPLWVHPAYVHRDSGGKPIFVHRCQGKFALGAQRFPTIQLPVRNDCLPLEAECFNWLREFAERWQEAPIAARRRRVHQRP